MNVIHYILFVLFFLTIYSICFKTIEGFNDDFYYYDKLIDYKTIPNSYVNDSIPSRTINKFGFYKGKGTFKKGYTKETKSDEKISTLNKLLNKLLGRIESDNQDCVGSFGKYSECDKSCGSNSYQTRTYNITKMRGKNGMDCPFVDGYEDKIRCGLDECQLGDLCKSNNDCETGNCDPNSTRCENMVPCDSKNFHVCNETDCINLNDDDDNNNNDNNDNNKDRKMIEGTYIYNNVDKECFFKTPAEIEKLNLNVFTYDFRTISENVKNFVLDCNYYQVKKNGVGPCVNASNIVMDNGNPKCLPGFGPEPTIFNKGYACNECKIQDPVGTPLENEVCYCPNGGVFNNESGSCTQESEATATATLCTSTDESLWFLKKVDPDGSCSIACPLATQQVRKSGSYVSCMTCPGNSQPYSSNCSEGDTGNVNCNLSKFLTKGYLDTPPDINEDGSNLSSLNYNEKCYTMDTEEPEIPCPYPSQSKVGDSCVCSDSGMNNKPPECSPSDDIETCSVAIGDPCNASNCLPGYHWNRTDRSGPASCVQCESQQSGWSAEGRRSELTHQWDSHILTQHCQSSSPGTCAVLENEQMPFQECAQCRQGYILGMNGMCNSCDTGYYSPPSLPYLSCARCPVVPTTDFTEVNSDWTDLISFCESVNALNGSCCSFYDAGGETLTILNAPGMGICDVCTQIEAETRPAPQTTAVTSTSDGEGNFVSQTFGDIMAAVR